MKRFLINWLICTVAVLMAAYVVKGIHFGTWLDLCVASLLLGILNAVLRPILTILTLPLLFLTLGLFRIVINAGLLYFVGYVLKPHFYVTDFWAAVWGGLVISIISIILGFIIGPGNTRVRIEQSRGPRISGDGSGPVIDV